MNHSCPCFTWNLLWLRLDNSDRGLLCGDIYHLYIVRLHSVVYFLSVYRMISCYSSSLHTTLHRCIDTSRRRLTAHYFLCGSIALVRFANRGAEEQFVLVGTVKELVLSPRACSAGYVHVYALSADGTRLSFLHRTCVGDDVPSAMVAFQGRVLVGVGRLLRIYDLGKKKLLRKCENKVGGSSSSSPPPRGRGDWAGVADCPSAMSREMGYNSPTE